MIAAIAIVAIVVMFALVAFIAWDDGKKQRTDPLRFDPVAHDRNVILGRANSTVERGQLVTVTLPTPGITNHRPVASFEPAGDRSPRAEIESDALMFELQRTELYRPEPALREDLISAELDSLKTESAPAPIWEAPAHEHTHHDSSPSHDHSSTSSFDHSSGGSDHGGGHHS